MDLMFNDQLDTKLTDKEKLFVRKKYFADYKVKVDEFITPQYELVCSLCNGKRYFQMNNFITGCRCRCQSEAIEKRKMEELAQQRMLKLQELRGASLLAERFRDASFDKLDLDRPDSFVKAVERCKTYCERWEEVKKYGQGIYLYGDVGTGKSLLTACIGNYLLSKMVTVLFTSFIQIAKQITKSYKSNTLTESDFIDKLIDVDLLIIDDIGTETLVKNGEETWIQDKIYDVINSRYIHQKPTIFSSNESLVELVNNSGLKKKTADRIGAMATAKIELRGSSYRLKENKNKSIF